VVSIIAKFGLFQRKGRAANDLRASAGLNRESGMSFLNLPKNP
jgi:hypothetical protein